MTNEELLQSISEMMDKKLQNFVTKDDLRELENNILEEVDTVQEKTNHHFKRAEKRLDNIEAEVHASKLQNDTLNLLLRRIDLMQDEINELKKKVS
jgi:uncharacterized protein involved in exopolysaccharide biosynthesis